MKRYLEWGKIYHPNATQFLVESIKTGRIFAKIHEMCLEYGWKEIKGQGEYNLVRGLRKMYIVYKESYCLIGTQNRNQLFTVNEIYYYGGIQVTFEEWYKEVINFISM